MLLFSFIYVKIIKIVVDEMLKFTLKGNKSIVTLFKQLFMQFDFNLII